MSAVRRFLKRAAEKLLVSSGMPSARLRRTPESIAILAYHNIVPDGEEAVGDRSLHLPRRRFAEQLDRLLDSHDVVELDAVRQPGATASGAKPRAVITFDDGYLGALTAGVDELRERELPATFFVNPGALEWEGFWWDLFADAESGELPAGFREYALDSLGGRHELIVDWARIRGMTPAALPPHARPASTDHLLRIGSDSLFTLASHTWSHPNLAALEEEELRLELERSRDWIREHAGSSSGWITYPYGLASELVMRVTGESYAGGLLVSGGAAGADWIRRKPHAVPRINVPSRLSAEGLVLRLAGLAGG
jgi:peptidoglycan/xylan/chitin deacetylase (PgdA/CDA1 family)